MKALVVDDSKLARVKLGKLLKERGIEVDTAESGEEAIERARRDPPNVIFMDHQMPSMDGIEAMKLIKSDPKTRNVPVIMCTGQDEAAFREMAASQGAVGVLTKPPVLEDLDRLLSEAAVPEETTPAEAPTQPAAEIHEILERITRIEARVPAPEHIEEQIAAVSESLRTAIRNMEEEIETRLATIADELSTPGLDAASIAEEAAQRAGEQVARRFAQFEHRIKELETALEAAISQEGRGPDPDSLAEQAAARIEAGLGERLEPLERKLSEIEASLSAEIEGLVQRTVSEIPAPPAVLGDGELERVKAVAESTAQRIAQQAVREQEAPAASAISEELEAELRALSEEIARETARATSQSEAQRVVEAHLSAVQESEPGNGKDETIARVDAVLRELREVREQNQGLRRQVYVAWVLAAAAIAAAIALPLVL